MDRIVSERARRLTRTRAQTVLLKEHLTLAGQMSPLGADGGVRDEHLLTTAVSEIAFETELSGRLTVKTHFAHQWRNRFDERHRDHGRTL